MMKHYANLDNPYFDKMLTQYMGNRLRAGGCWRYPVPPMPSPAWQRHSVAALLFAYCPCGVGLLPPACGGRPGGGGWGIAHLPKPDEPEPNCRSGYARHGGRSPPYGLTRIFFADSVEFVIGGEIVPVSFGDGLLNFCDLPGFQISVASGFHRMLGLQFYQCRHFGSRTGICKVVIFLAHTAIYSSDNIRRLPSTLAARSSCFRLGQWLGSSRRCADAQEVSIARARSDRGRSPRAARSSMEDCTAAVGEATGLSPAGEGAGSVSPCSMRYARTPDSTSAALNAASSGVSPSVNASSKSRNCTKYPPPSWGVAV